MSQYLDLEEFNSERRIIEKDRYLKEMREKSKLIDEMEMNERARLSFYEAN